VIVTETDMPTIRRSIVVDAPVEITFDLSNRIELWPQMMEEYKQAEIVKREGRMIWFRLRHQNGISWTSWRMLYPPSFACAERFEPKAPFKYMHIIWTYEAVGDASQTEMVWDMTFELPDDQKHKEDEWSANMLEHTQANQQRMKLYIERHVKEHGASL
jgi:ribosome-associated toxin RatA of RatAB toxin-antitoxin module